MRTLPVSNGSVAVSASDAPKNPDVKAASLVTLATSTTPESLRLMMVRGVELVERRLRTTSGCPLTEPVPEEEEEEEPAARRLRRR
jgi:hypothetical protein